MPEYIPLKDYAKAANIKKGDIVFVSSRTVPMLFDAKRAKVKPNLNDFIDGMLEAIGEDGTLIFPTYNWDFCKGIEFDYKNSPCMTGALGTAALTRSEFKRTKHPIYSFAVAGACQDILCSMDNKSSFGKDSPFNFFKEKNVINLIFDVVLKHSFTYVHYVEEMYGKTSYRYLKEFSADYIDESGNRSSRNYSMLVRKLEINVENTVDPIIDDFIAAGCMERLKINSSDVKKIYLGDTFDVIMKDIIDNNSKKICTFDGQ